MSKCTTNCNQGRSCQCGPVVIKTSTGLLGWALHITDILRQKWAMFLLRRKIESLECLHIELFHELSVLRSQKFKDRFAKTPTLDARIEASEKEFKKIGDQLDSVIDQYANGNNT